MEKTGQVQKTVLNYAVEYLLPCITQFEGKKTQTKQNQHSHVTHLVSGSAAVCIIVTYLVPGRGGRSKAKEAGRVLLCMCYNPGSGDSLSWLL